jgi:hypothetical protein
LDFKIMKTGKRIIISAATTVGILAILFALLMLSGLSEGYCYFYPSIDTRYADGYSETDFSRLTVGMTRQEVDQIMCPPLYTWTNTTGLLQVYWTGDGKAPFGDFAWFGRGVEVSNGVVIRVVNQIYYD